MGGHVDRHCAVVLALAEGEVVDAQYFHLLDVRLGYGSDQAQESVLAHGDTGRGCQAGSRPPRQGQADPRQHPVPAGCSGCAAWSGLPPARRTSPPDRQSSRSGTGARTTRSQHRDHPQQRHSACVRTDRAPALSSHHTGRPQQAPVPAPRAPLGPAACLLPRSAARTGTETAPRAHHESTQCMTTNSPYNLLRCPHHKIVDRTRILTLTARSTHR